MRLLRLSWKLREIMLGDVGMRWSIARRRKRRTSSVKRCDARRRRKRIVLLSRLVRRRGRGSDRGRRQWRHKTKSATRRENGLV
jgi:hypothetical protein